MRTYILLIASLFVLNSCSYFNSKNEVDIKGTWRLQDISVTDNTKDADDFLRTATLSKLVKDGLVFCFFEDGVYAELNGKGEYNIGKWKLSKKEEILKLISAEKTSKNINVKFGTDGKGNQLLNFYNEDENLKLQFVKESEPMTDIKNDPFYPENNKWRIKPSKPESTVEVNNRLTNYVKHVALILKAAKERKQEIVSFEFSQGPIKIYRNGIGVHSYDIVPTYWKERFYNENQAITAYTVYDHLIETSSYKGASIGNWIEDDYNILLSIYAGLTDANKISSQ